MRVETASGTRFRLTYGDDGSLAAPAVGFDRAALDPALLDLARQAGADVRLGVAAVGVERGRIVGRDADGETDVEARVVVGADGIRSIVARVVRRRPTAAARRSGRPDVPRRRSRADRPARRADDPVPTTATSGWLRCPAGASTSASSSAGAWPARLRHDGAERTVAAVLAAIPPADDDPVDWRAAERCDPIEGAAPLGHRVARRHGPGWLLVGDAAGFLDPFTGEGLHRALVSARLAAGAIDRHLDGDTDGARRPTTGR